jgi:outer membrane protein
MKKILLSTIVTASLVSCANADFLGAEVGVASWQPSLTGSIRKGGDDINFEKDLGYGDITTEGTNGFAWAYFDHFIPLIPNIKVQQTKYSDSSVGTLDKSINFAGKTFNLTDTVSSSFTLDQLDVIPYWRILDNWVNLDLGFNFKVIDGNVKLDSTTTHANEDFSIIIPMGYAKGRFDMPFTGFSVEADVSYIGFNGNSFRDIKAGFVYETPFGLGATVGYRVEQLSLDNIDDTYATVDIKGAYFGVFYHF